ncbi:glutamine amidotransferase [Leucobacter sp. OH1287]|nr:glutamine amidotransferase [Leucobacter sp. OH1287]
MNMYGDRGNVLALLKRIRQHGFEAELVSVNCGDELPLDGDIYVGGGGQDSGQVRVAKDLKSKAAALSELADRGVPMLMICGMYQLFGKEFRTVNGEIMEGVGILDVTTVGGQTRMIGNIVLDCGELGEVIGYENHSGNTVLGPDAEAFGSVKQGDGNNPEDGTEGARYREVIGTYLHGALLPKNPSITDHLIRVAAINRYGEFTPAAIDDTAINQARQAAKSRPR